MKPLDCLVPAAGELPDQQIVTEASEIERCQCTRPRSIQPRSMFETPQELSRGFRCWFYETTRLIA